MTVDLRELPHQRNRLCQDSCIHQNKYEGALIYVLNVKSNYAKNLMYGPHDRYRPLFS